MSFILRQITQRVGAPDIVREKPLAAAEPVIGRGSDCDIQLSDLAVSLRHAVVKQTAPGKVSVDALGAENMCRCPTSSRRADYLPGCAVS